MTAKLLPITAVTVMLDLDDRLKRVEKILKIKLPPFKKRSLKYRKPSLGRCR